MAGSVSIENLRNIEQLDFDMPLEGVWLLAGGNGSGKTTLLACLRRIGSANAFPIHFPSSLQSNALDNFGPAKSIYRVNNEEVEYAYRGERWAPRPRRNSHLLRQFGYPSVIYIGATPDRITPRPEDFNPRRVIRASDRLIDVANRIFETDKFSELRTINLTRGIGNQAFVLRVKAPPQALFHSEKQFSLGELCILKLIRALEECPNQSLLLIDELEMALHPRVQIQLYRYLCEIAQSKHLTVLFSTHSVSLLKSVPRKKLIFLQRSERRVEALTGCFPTYIIGQITLGEERAPDKVIYVEDDVAVYIVEALVKLSLSHRYENQNHLFPTVKIVPIGGFEQVVHFLKHHDATQPAGVRSVALLDADVKDETVREWMANENHQRLSWFEELGDQIQYLPWTPEVGLIHTFRSERNESEADLKAHFNDHQIVLDRQDFDDIPQAPGCEQRRHCKNIFWEIRRDICRVTALSQEEVERGLCEVFAKRYFETNQEPTLQLLNPMLH